MSSIQEQLGNLNRAITELEESLLEAKADLQEAVEAYNTAVAQAKAKGEPTETDQNEYLRIIDEEIQALQDEVAVLTRDIADLKEEERELEQSDLL